MRLFAARKIPRFIWVRTLKALKVVTHPVFVFVSLQVVWVAIIFLWVFWFLNQKETFTQLALTLGKSVDTTSGLVFLVIGCVLLGIIMVGVVALFVFAQRQASLIRQQKGFVSSVTHELRSPLASLQLSFETLQKPALPPAIAAKLHQMMSRDIARLSRLIDRILISARLDQGIIDQSREPELLVMNEVIRLAIDEAAYRDPDIQQRLKITGNPEITCKSSRLALVLIINNLLENALKYSPAKTPIEIHISKTDLSVTIAISDQGFGISRKDLRKIFRMFHRAEIATKKAIPGTGLGLFIVKTTVRSLNGQIWVLSPGLGKGSTFYVSLPLGIDSSRL